MHTFSFSTFLGPKLMLLPCLQLSRWASLVIQGLRISLPVQGTWVQSLVWEDLTCHEAIKPVCRKYWAGLWNARAETAEGLQTLEPVRCQQAKSLQWEACEPQLESSPALSNQRKPVCSNKNPEQPKINLKTNSPVTPLCPRHDVPSSKGGWAGLTRPHLSPLLQPH